MKSFACAMEARSVANWVRRGWHVAVGYAFGFAVLLLLYGWNPETIPG